MAGNGYSVDDILDEIRRKKENGAAKATDAAMASIARAHPTKTASVIIAQLTSIKTLLLLYYCKKSNLL